MDKKKSVKKIKNEYTASHNIEDECLKSLTNITVHCLPLNMTSVLPTMDAGIISTFKHYYKKLLEYLNQLEETTELCIINIKTPYMCV